MSNDERFRNSLQRLVPAPDEAAGWREVNRRIFHGRRRRTALSAVAVVAAVLFTAAGISVVQNDGPQNVNTAAPNTTTTEAGRRTGATAPPATASTPDSGPGSTATPGTRPGSTSTAPATTSAQGPNQGQGQQQGQNANNAPPATGDDTTDPSDPAPVTTAPESNTTITLPDTAVPVAREAIEDYLDGRRQVRSISEAQVDENGHFDTSGRWVVQVTLRADATALADDLIARWGNTVAVTVGFFPYPEEPPANSSCHALEPAVPLPKTVAATVKVSPSPIPRGADFTGTLTLTNKGSATLPVNTSGSTLVDLLLPGTNTVVASYDGGLGLDGLNTAIKPGASKTLKITGATASCSGLGGYAVPGGNYTGRVRLTIGMDIVEYRFAVAVAS